MFPLMMTCWQCDHVQSKTLDSPSGRQNGPEGKYAFHILGRPRESRSIRNCASSRGDIVEAFLCLGRAQLFSWVSFLLELLKVIERTVNNV